MRLLLIVASLFSWVSCSFSPDVYTAVSREDPWDLDGPCQVFVERLSVALGSIVQCAANFTIPPKVCTNCIDQYMHFKQIEFETKNQKDVRSLDNTSCSEVIYQNYLLSYVNELSESIEKRIWDQSRCDACINITWNFTHNSSDYDYVPHTYTFSRKLLEWRSCISNYTGNDDGSMLENSNATGICKQCGPQFDDLFQYYWVIYVSPGVQFCVDVETTMNDTVRLWNEVWQCAEKKDRYKDATLVMITTGVLCLFTAFFYLSSYIQGDGETRRFVRYSVMRNPAPARQRLLSSSASDTNLSSRASSLSQHHQPGTARIHVTPRRPN